MEWEVFIFGFVLGVFLTFIILLPQSGVKKNRQTVFDLSQTAQAQRAMEEAKHIFRMAPRLTDQLQEVLGTFEMAAQKTSDPVIKKDLEDGIKRILSLRKSFQDVLRLTSNEKNQIDNKSGFNLRVTKDLPALVVDDNAVIRKTSEALLLSLGFQCETAESGAEALKILREKKFGVVLLDISMPDIDGVSVTKEIRNGSGPNKNTLIVAVTGLTRRGDRENLLSQGINGYLAKPIKIDELKNLLVEG